MTSLAPPVRLMKVLHLEDHPRDAVLVRDQLEMEWPDVELTLASNREEFVNALGGGGYDVILSDFKLPRFSGRDALDLARAEQPHVPFIFVSGTIGEDTAAEVVRAGAADYLLKDRLQRLPHAIRRAMRDNDERRRRRVAEERIHEQAELLDKVHDGIVVTTMTRRVLYWNQGAERIFGWTSAEAVGKRIEELFGTIATTAFDTMEQHLREAEEWRGEVSLENRAHAPLLAEIRVTAVRDGSGQPTSRLSIVTDITERKALEDQLLRAQRLESLGMLAAGIAHDLNNALAPMLMAGGLLRGRVSDPSDVRLIELLEHSAERGAALVKQIVAFAGGQARGKFVVQLKHLVRDVVNLLQDTFPKSIRLEHEVPNNLATIRGDPTQLHQVLLNLCINARDAMPHGGILRLNGYNRTLTEAEAREFAGATPGRFVVLEVADSGTGIQPEVLAHIWEPFFTTKAEGKGTGLGLSTVRGIVSNHGGFVTVESALGAGATFRVFLPASEEDGASAEDTAAVRRSVGRGRGELVFVVDDQVSVRESIGVVLSKHGYRPFTIADGIEALSKYADRIRDVSVVITDIDMPGLNGIAFADAIRHLNPEAKILFISGTADGEAPKSLGLGANQAFLAKPFTPEVLLAKLDSLLRGSAE